MINRGVMRSPAVCGELVARLVVGGIFLFSGGMKLLDPAAFQAEIANFELVSWTLAGLVAVWLPWLEVLCGAALVANIRTNGALLIVGVLMVLFVLVVASAWARGLDVTCGCFGTSDSAPNYPLWIGRNLLILAGVCAIPWLRRRNGRYDSFARESRAVSFRF